MKRKKIYCKALILGFLLLAALSCKPEYHVPDYVIPVDSMVSIVVDIHLAEALVEHKNFSNAEDLNKSRTYYYQVLKKYQLERARLDTSIYYYSAHPTIYEHIYEQAIKKIDIMIGEIEKETISKEKEEISGE